MVNPGIFSPCLVKKYENQYPEEHFVSKKSIFDPIIHLFDSALNTWNKEEGFVMENEKVKRNLYRALRKTGVRKEDISLDASFQNDLHFDTTDWKIFTYYLENIFKVNVEDEGLKNLRCVSDTLNLIK